MKIFHDAGPIRVRLRLRDPTQAVRTDPQPPADHDGPQPGREQDLDGRNNRKLVLTDEIQRLRLSEADRLADHLQKVHRDAGSVAQLLERGAAELREPVERARIQE